MIVFIRPRPVLLRNADAISLVFDALQRSYLTFISAVRYETACMGIVNMIVDANRGRMMAFGRCGLFSTSLTCVSMGSTDGQM